jgi:hypothetical protein
MSISAEGLEPLSLFALRDPILFPKEEPEKGMKAAHSEAVPAW